MTSPSDQNPYSRVQTDRQQHRQKTQPDQERLPKGRRKGFRENVEVVISEIPSFGGI